MAIQYVGGQSGSSIGTTSNQTITFALTGGLASTPAADDLVIVSFSVGASSDQALSIQNTGGTNYTLIASELVSTDSFVSNLRTAYRFMPSTPETQFVVFDDAGATSASAYTVHVFRGVHAVDTLDVAATTATGINTRLPNPASITPTTAGSWIYVVGGGAGATGATYTASYLTAFQTARGDDNQDAMIGAGYVEWTSGAYDPAVFTGGGTDSVNDSWTAVTVALRPASSTSTVSADGAGSYAVIAAVQKDAAESYAVTGIAQKDAVASYGFWTAVTSDGAGSYAVIAAVSADATGTYPVPGKVSNDGAGAYAVIATVSADGTGNVITLDDVQADSATATYSVTSAIAQNATETYTVLNSVQADGNFSYAVILAVVQGSTEFSYSVIQSVTSDRTAGWQTGTLDGSKPSTMWLGSGLRRERR